MSDIHFHCVSCKKDQWLDEDVSSCSYCSADTLMEIVEEDEPDLLEIAEQRMQNYWLDRVS